MASRALARGESKTPEMGYTAPSGGLGYYRGLNAYRRLGLPRVSVPAEEYPSSSSLEEGAQGPR